jgi:hypothetical protein
LIDAPSTATVRGRLIALHELLEETFNNNANDRAIKILREIAIESKDCKFVIPEAPSADPRVRLTYWHRIFERMRKFGKVEQSVDLLREIRKESSLCN